MLKNKFRYICLIMVFCMVLVGSVGTSFVSAVSYNENRLSRIRLFYNAADRCVRGGKWKNVLGINLSSSDSGNKRDKAQKYILFEPDALFKSGSDGRSYSAFLETFTTNGYQDGKVHCDEMNLIYKLFGSDNGMDLWYVYETEKLMCKGAERGLFKIISGFRIGNESGDGDNKYLNKSNFNMNPGGNAYALREFDVDIEADWPANLSGNGTNCQGNLTFLKYYLEHPDENVAGLKLRDKNTGEVKGTLDFKMKIELAEDVVGAGLSMGEGPSYFEDYINSLVDLNSSSDVIKNYWVSYHTFDRTCADIRSGSLTKPNEATGNMVGLYDMETRKIYYHNVGNIKNDETRFYTMFNDDKKMCGVKSGWENKSFAKDLGAEFNGGAINRDRIEELVVANSEEDVESCEAKFEEAIRNYQTYYSNYNNVVEMASDSLEVAESVYNGVYNFLHSGGSGSFYLLSGITTPVVSSVISNRGIVWALDNWASIMDNGSYPAIFPSGGFRTLADKISEIVENTVTEESGRKKIVSVDTSIITEEYLAQVSSLLAELKLRFADADDTSDSLSEILSRYNSDDDPWIVNIDPTNNTDTGILCNGLDELKAALTNLALPGAPSIGGWTPSSPSIDPIHLDPLSGETDPCFANAGSFGWVVCPAIDGMAEATDGISGLLNDWLSIDVNLYDGDSGTYDAWGYFRTFANVAIIIVMLVVIFSQLTGVGIDNYGIKKLLPKIIITAILINLSYVICELVIDLSNILGVGLNHLFQSVGRTVDSALSPGQVTQTVVGYLLAGLAGAGALAGSVITIVGAASGGAAMVIVTLILILLTALVAVLLFFMAIGARAIIIILFTAIAPVAVVMYALPNTQGIFKKYINIFKTALVVYPICGGLYGISYVIRGIVFGSGEVPFHMAMVVLCAPYLPFFALPSLTKGALAGLGAVGAAFTALGAGIRSGIGKGRKAVEGTDAYRKGMERGKVGLAARRAQAFKRRDDRRTARGIRNAGDRARFNELNDRINSGQRLSDPEKEEYRRLSGSSSYRRSEAREARYASANEAIRAHEDQRGKNRTNSDNLVAAGMLEGDRYKNDKTREEAEGWMDDYLVDSSGNTWIADGNGGYTTVDRSGRSRTVNATQARDMLQNGGRLVSRREAMSGRDRISRADETGRLAAHANSDRVTAAAAGSRLANLETSQSGLREAALSGRDDVIMLQHDKNVDKRRGVIGEAEAYEEFRGLEGASTTISREAARQAAREKLEDVSAKNRVAAGYANKLANGDYAPDGGTYDRAAATLDSIRTKAMKGLNQKDTEAMINQVGEVGVDLNVARANAQSASNTTAGKQQAMAEFLREGRDVVTSVNAARQAAETQLAGTVGQNLSADDYENKVNSGVYDRTEVRNNAIEAARIKNINQTTNTIESNAAGEVEVNREVARTNAMSAHNAAVGKQDATMNFINEYGQDRVATSVSAARQAAETQLAGTVGQNLAATVYDERVSQGEYNPSEVREKAVNAQTVKAVNQTTNTIESNAVGEVEITPEYARSVAQSRFDTTQQRMYGEQLSNNTRNQSLADLAGALVGADGTVGTIKGTAVGGEHMNSDQVNYVTAAIKDVMAKGGVEDLNRLIMNASGTIAAKPELAEAIYSEMATMSVEPEMKAYGKYAMGKIEKIKNGERNVTMLDYDGWLNAADNAGDLDGKESLAGYIRANGDTVLVGASKDTFKFYEGDGDLTNKFSPTQVLKGALSARDGETRVAANKMLRKRIGSDDAALTQAINGITISQWANMESGTLNALMGNHINNPGQVSGDLKASLEEIGRKLKGSGPTVKANIRPEVKAYFKQLGIDIDIKGKS